MFSSFVTDEKLSLREANEFAQSSKIEEQLELGFEPSSLTLDLCLCQ